MAGTITLTKWKPIKCHLAEDNLALDANKTHMYAMDRHQPKGVQLK